MIILPRHALTFSSIKSLIPTCFIALSNALIFNSLMVSVMEAGVAEKGEEEAVAAAVCFRSAF